MHYLFRQKTFFVSFNHYLEFGLANLVLDFAQRGTISDVKCHRSETLKEV